MDSLELLTRYGHVDPADDPIIDAAAMAALDAPDLDRASGPRPAWPRRTLVGAASVAAAAALGVTGVTLATGTGRPSAPASHTLAGPSSTAQHAGSPGSHTVLARLADAVLSSPTPAGDATLVIRSQVETGGSPIPGADLYTDGGNYYYAPTESGLPAQVVAGNDQGNGLFAREIAAAEQAATGSNLAMAAQAMEDAPNPTAAPTAAISSAGVALADNWLWEDSLTALSAGAGNPTVRAGVMRLVSTIPQVKVTNTTANGEPAVTITNVFPAMATGVKAKAIEQQLGVGSLARYQEQLTIDATTGIPISFSGGAPGQPPASQITYQVSRVTLSQVAQGHFVAEPTTSTSGA
ncbi:MAG: hypothetical protein ACRDYZ_16590 [Acidimicrobiales bacterium]